MNVDFLHMEKEFQSLLFDGYTICIGLEKKSFYLLIQNIICATQNYCCIYQHSAFISIQHLLVSSIYQYPASISIRHLLISVIHQYLAFINIRHLLVSGIYQYLAFQLYSIDLNHYSMTVNFNHFSSMHIPFVQVSKRRRSIY